MRAFNFRSRLAITGMLPMAMVLLFWGAGGTLDLAKANAADRVYDLNTGLSYPGIQAAIGAPETLDGHVLSLTADSFNESLVITKSLTLIGAGPGLSRIDGGAASRVISIPAGTAVQLIGLSVENGLSVGDDAGGIFNSGDLTLSDTWVISNTDYGNLILAGGVLNEGSLDIIDSVLDHNVAENADGVAGLAIYNNGLLTVTHSEVAMNRSFKSVPSMAAIFNSGVATIRNTTIQTNTGIGVWNDIGGRFIISNSLTLNNTGGWGEGGNNSSVGGIYNAGSMTITGSLVGANSIALFGATDYNESGGILNDGVLAVSSSTITANTSCQTGAGVYNRGTATIVDSTLSGNSQICHPGSAGGGLVNDGQLTMTTSTVARNQADSGGGVLAHGGIAVLNGVTVAQNTAPTSGGGIEQVGGAIMIENTLLAENGVEVGAECTGLVQSLGSNLVANDSGCTFSPAAGDMVGTAGSPLAAGLGPLGNYDGPTPTVGLIAGSPAIDKGNPVTCKGTDQRGDARQGVCDIGAYEYGIGKGVSLALLPLVQQ